MAHTPVRIDLFEYALMGLCTHRLRVCVRPTRACECTPRYSVHSRANYQDSDACILNLLQEQLVVLVESRHV